MKIRPLMVVALMGAALAMGWSAATRGGAVPEPGVVPTAWELTFKQHAPERIFVATPGKSGVQPYWYIRYKVTNNSGKDLLFTPEIQLLTDTGQIITSGKNVPDAVYDKIKALYGDPLMDSPVEVLGKILQGEDNAKESVAIFAGVDPDARNFRILISGLSGETAEVTNPLTSDKVLLRKTLVLEYDIPGQAIGITPQPQFKSETWTMK